MLLGIHIKLNDANLYSKPFLLNTHNDSFIAQVIRDIDFSFLMKKKENFLLNIIKYTNKNSFYEFNKHNKECEDSIKIGSFNLIFDEVSENMSIGDFEKGIFKKVLDEQMNLVIIFSVIHRKDEDDYIFSTPMVTGNNSFLK